MPKTDESGDCRRFHNEEPHSLCHSPNIVRKIHSIRLEWEDHVSRLKEGTSAFKMLTGEPTGKRPLIRPRHRWKDNIRMLKETYQYEELG